MIFALDASVLIAHLDTHDVHHRRATALLATFAGSRLVAHPLTIAECLVGAVRLDRGVEVRDLLTEMRVEAVPVNADMALRLAGLRVSSRLRMPDCCVLDVAIEHHATLVTFDERLARTARDRNLAVRPDGDS